MLRNENIISMTPRNVITIVTMVTIGWFLLHILGVTADMIGSYLAGFQAGEDASVNDNQASVNATVTF